MLTPLSPRSLPSTRPISRPPYANALLTQPAQAKAKSATAPKFAARVITSLWDSQGDAVANRSSALKVLCQAINGQVPSDQANEVAVMNEDGDLVILGAQEVQPYNTQLHGDAFKDAVTDLAQSPLSELESMVDTNSPDLSDLDKPDRWAGLAERIAHTVPPPDFSNTPAPDEEDEPGKEEDPAEERSRPTQRAFNRPLVLGTLPEDEAGKKRLFAETLLEAEGPLRNQLRRAALAKTVTEPTELTATLNRPAYEVAGMLEQLTDSNGNPLQDTLLARTGGTTDLYEQLLEDLGFGEHNTPYKNAIRDIDSGV